MQAPTSAGGPAEDGVFCHQKRDRSNLEGLGAEDWTKKSASALQAPTSAGGPAEDGVFCHQKRDRSDLEGLGAEDWTKKSASAPYLREKRNGFRRPLRF
ncbi:hypothetical protein B0X71_02265 [Planococcus lenghuensis]|uniref:Uncharacterized protein n=1 Tax=Planococcus lenghuensis TaxID=2213202 RepID=A0A1Q2KV46_9BACL|nr:hypothetical protein B0X71_02265 [Planococcus lenghuensis]